MDYANVLTLKLLSTLFSFLSNLMGIKEKFLAIQMCTYFALSYT